MKEILKKADGEQLDALWTAIYDARKVIFDIEDVKTTKKRAKLYAKNEIVFQLSQILVEITREMTKRNI